MTQCSTTKCDNFAITSGKCHDCLEDAHELREEYSKVLAFSKKHGYSSGLPCALDDFSCG